MICAKCGETNDAKFKFCDSCGAELIALKPAKPEKAVALTPEGAPSVVMSSLPLTTWAGLRWLFATNYGSLSITETHLNYQIDRLWASPIYSIIVKIFSWGFDFFSSTAIGRGATTLKSISTVRILAIDWIIWKGHFIFIWAGGFPDIYIFSATQLPAARGFVESLKIASTNFKYTVSK